MYGESNMETYITIYKVDCQQVFAVWLRKLKQGFCINLFDFPEPYNEFPLAIYFIYGNVSSMLLFPYISPSPPLSPCP